MAFESKHKFTVNSNALKETCTNLISVDLFNNTIINSDHKTVGEDSDIDLQNISPPTNNCKYVFDFKDPNL